MILCIFTDIIILDLVLTTDDDIITSLSVYSNTSLYYIYHFRSLCNNLLSKHKPTYFLHQNFYLSMFLTIQKVTMKA